MNLPEDWEEFYEEMCGRAKKLIEIKYWTISHRDLKMWLDNFKSEEEKFLASVLLYRITFRNRDAIRSMFCDVVDIVIPGYLKRHGIYDADSIDEFRNDLGRHPGSYPFRFATIENIDTGTAKSGPVLLRDFQRFLGIHKSFLVGPDKFPELPDRVGAIILIDDILGTGSNLRVFYGKYIEPVIDRINFLYIPLSAYVPALEKIQEEMKQIEVVPVEKIEREHTFFSKSLLPPRFSDKLDLHELEELYVKVVKKIGMKKNYHFGYGGLALTHCFEDSVPNNMLPVFYYNSPDWHKLFTR